MVEYVQAFPKDDYIDFGVGQPNPELLPISKFTNATSQLFTFTFNVLFDKVFRIKF